MDQSGITQLQPYPLNIQVGDIVIDWQVKYFQSDDPAVYRGVVIATEKPEGFTVDTSGDEWSEEYGDILVEFPDGGKFLYPLALEHYLAKEGDPEVPVANERPFLQLNGAALDLMMPSCQPPLVVTKFLMHHHEHYKELLAEQG